MKKTVFVIIAFVVCFVPMMAQISGHVRMDVGNLSFSKLGEYDVIRMEGCAENIRQTGAPELPMVVRTFVVPQDAKVTGVDVTVTRRVEQDGEFVPYPVQPPVKVGDDDGAGFVHPDSAIYGGAECYPAIRADIGADYVEMGWHLVTVMLYPVEYDPVSRKIYLNDISFTLRYETGAQVVDRPQVQGGRRAAMIKKMIKAMVDNPEDVDRFADVGVKIVGAEIPNEKLRGLFAMSLGAISEQIPDYIIITNNELRDEFQRLADWKIKKGVPAIIKVVEDIKTEYQGSDLAEKIHAYLQECRHKWGDGLFVLLGGDTDIVPPRMYKDGNLFFPTDLYYTDLDCDWNTNKNHIYAEKDVDKFCKNRCCYIGRASVENTAEAELFIDKVLAYEKMDAPDLNTNYLMNHLVASAYISKNDQTGFMWSDGQKLIDDTLSLYPQIKKWYVFDHYNCDCNKHAAKAHYDSGEELNKVNFLSALNDGGHSGLGNFHIVYHMDHSSTRAMGTSSKDKSENMSVYDADGLINGDYHQIVISGGCNPAQFNTDCIAEHFINNPNGGAVAFIGNANSGHANDEKQYTCFLNSLYKDECVALGELFGRMSLKGYGSLDADHIAYNNTFRLHLLGDPEMPVWSSVPQNLDVKVSSTKGIGGVMEIKVRVANLPEGQDAQLCLMKGGEGYLSVTISDTQEHTFTFAPKISGDINVTVTAHNFFPYETEIPVDASYDNILSVYNLLGFDGSVAIGDTAVFRVALSNRVIRRQITLL